MRCRDRAAIEENGRRASHTEFSRFLDVRGNTLLCLVTVYAFAKAVQIETKVCCILVEWGANVAGLSPVVAFAVKQVVHLPKAPLQPSCFRRNCGFARVLMTWQGQVTEHDAQLIFIFLFEAAQRVGELGAGGTLKIAELLQSNDGIRRSANVSRRSNFNSDGGTNDPFRGSLRSVCAIEQRSRGNRQKGD